MSNEAKYISLNGNFYLAGNPVLSHKNRAFCYSDALFETMRAYQEKVQFFPEHYQRLSGGMDMLKMNIPVAFTQNRIHDEITGLLKKNRIYKGARVRLTVFRNDGGFYIPECNDISYLIEVSELENIFYGSQPKGLHIGLFDEIRKPVNIFSGLKTTNSLLFVMAGLHAKNNHWDDCVILNDEGNIVESVSSNIFMIRDKIIYTPKLSDGCINGIMRCQIINLARSLNYEVLDDVSLQPQNLLEADEAFLTNAVAGITWVLGFEKRRFFHDVSANLTVKLNETAFNS
ncbi:MAG: aminotransferase class IV family protein [Bacteroidia bacterium]|nr:aminotransferase class IV family protein [Bacteroidia bacterium]